MFNVRIHPQQAQVQPDEPFEVTAPSLEQARFLARELKRLAHINNAFVVERDPDGKWVQNW